MTQEAGEAVEIDHVGSAPTYAELALLLEAARGRLYPDQDAFGLTKSDLRARPVFHHQRDAIEAHLSVVFAALAITRYLTDTTGVSIKKLITTLRTVRSATIEINGQHLTLEQEPPAEIQEILKKLAAGH